MSTANGSRPHWSFWVIGTVALLWNAAGAVNFFVQMNPEWLAAYRESERAIVAGRPAWATVAFGLAVFGGTLGCGLLLLRRATATPVFLVSLLGVIGVMAHSLSLEIAFGIGEIVGIVVMPLAVAAFLLWYARRAAHRGWTR